MLGLDRLALLLERQGTAEGPAAAGAEDVDGGLPDALARARALRAQGRRVRLGGRR
jgi:hypothetical protein